jgi:hypothetical protein
VGGIRVSIVRGGDISGMVRRTELSSDALPPEAAEELEAMVATADIRGLASERPPERRPDETAYEIEIEDPRGTSVARLSETTLPESVRNLVAWVDARDEREMRIE